MSIEMRYPLGKFTPPQGLDLAVIRRQIPVLASLPGALRQAVEGLDDVQLDTPYRDGGWTVRQLVHHVADSHMHASARTRYALTDNGTTIMGYDEAVWAELIDARTLPVEPSLQILDGLHRRWVALLDALSEAQWQHEYLHPQYQSRWPLWKVLALYEWHGRHHTAHITELRRREGW